MARNTFQALLFSSLVLSASARVLPILTFSNVFKARYVFVIDCSNRISIGKETRRRGGEERRARGEKRREELEGRRGERRGEKRREKRK